VPGSVNDERPVSPEVFELRLPQLSTRTSVHEDIVFRSASTLILRSNAMMETEQGGSDSCRHISAQSAKEFLATIWMELLDWGAIALNSAGRFLTAMLNFVMLAVAAIIAVLAVIVLIAREQITKPSEEPTFSLISAKTFLGKRRASVSD
jgi:hypothetical protein